VPVIIIQGTPVELADSAGSPNWAPGVIEAFQLLASALQGVVGNFDVSPQSISIDGASFNPTSSPQDIAPLSFPTASVRSVSISYAVYRTAESPSAVVAEEGDIQAIYNSDAGTWEISREYTGNANITFSITNTGQIQFETTAIGTTNHLGRIIFSAKALEQE
jgi:hypothetical protein